MVSRVYSAAVFGVDAYEVEIEVNAGGGDSAIVVVGLPDTAVKESRDRVTTALGNSGFRWPKGRTTINLAPADVKKEGPSFDLPIALGMIAVSDGLDPQALAGASFLGELALTGGVRPVKGVLPIALEARRQGRKKLFVPAANAAEAAVVEGIEVFGVSSLRDTCEALRGHIALEPTRRDPSLLLGHAGNHEDDFADVRGQLQAKRALEIAAAGMHNALLVGPPGSGKSMLAKRLPGILPAMTLEEAIETTKIHSICGLLGSQHAFVGTRPFRSPHHTISDVGLIGGSASPAPGELSLAHHGVLFLDELPEFRRTTLEVMRQPLEDGKVTISRAAGTMTFPAEFMLVAAMNPCPCGHYGDPRKECRCGPTQIGRYRQRISGPLLDRIDLHVEVPAVGYEDLSASAQGESSAAIGARVERARAIQARRFAGHPRVRCNARMTSRLLRQHAKPDAHGLSLLRVAMEELGLSARAHDRILKVARTIADLAGEENLSADHLGEAISYRSLDRSLWV